MSEQVDEFIQSAEEQAARGEVNEAFYQSLRDWLKTDYRGELRGLLSSIKPNRPAGKEASLGLANLGRDFARVLNLFMIDPEASAKWGEIIWDDVFGGSPDSIVNCRSPKNRDHVEEQLIGPLSVLSIISLVAESRPDLLDSIRELKQIAPGGHLDVINKVDLVFDFGDKVERLVQLKAPRMTTEFNVWRVDRERYPSAEYVRRHLVGHSDVKEMVSEAERRERYQKGKVVELFVIMVPAIDTKTRGNLFDKVRLGRVAERVQFGSAADKSGFFPEGAYVK